MYILCDNFKKYNDEMNVTYIPHSKVSLTVLQKLYVVTSFFQDDCWKFFYHILVSRHCHT